jgi:hypothetical protein
MVASGAARGAGDSARARGSRAGEVRVARDAVRGRGRARTRAWSRPPNASRARRASTAPADRRRLRAGNAAGSKGAGARWRHHVRAVGVAAAPRRRRRWPQAPGARLEVSRGSRGSPRGGHAPRRAAPGEPGWNASALTGARRRKAPGDATGRQVDGSAPSIVAGPGPTGLLGLGRAGALVASIDTGPREVHGTSDRLPRPGADVRRAAPSRCWLVQTSGTRRRRPSRLPRRDAVDAKRVQRRTPRRAGSSRRTSRGPRSRGGRSCLRRAGGIRRGSGRRADD